MISHVLSAHSGRYYAADTLIRPSCAPPSLDEVANCSSNERRTRRRLSAIRNESVPIQLAQCQFPGRAICKAKILTYFSNKIHGSNFIKQHTETVTVWNYQNADCSLRKKTLLRYLLQFSAHFRCVHERRGGAELGLGDRCGVIVESIDARRCRHQATERRLSVVQ